MPTGLDDSHSTTRHQTGTGTVGEPLVSLLEDLEVPVNHILFGVWVVHKKQVGTATSQSTTNTASVVLASDVSIPTASRLRISSEANRRENRPVRRCVNEVSHFPPEVHGQIGRVGHHHNLLIGVLSDEPCREEDGNELGFTMSRRNIHANPVFAPLGNVHKQVCQHSVMCSDLVIGLHVAAKRYQIARTRLGMHPIPQRIDDFFNFSLFFRLKLVNMLDQILDLLYGEVIKGWNCHDLDPIP